jgi:hexosaminidase
MQGHLWSETVRTSENFDYMVYNRMLAVAERAWHKASWESVTDVVERDKQMAADWEAFANTLGYKELSRLDDMLVMYAVQPPGVR